MSTSNPQSPAPSKTDRKWQWSNDPFFPLKLILLPFILPPVLLVLICLELAPREGKPKSRTNPAGAGPAPHPADTSPLGGAEGSHHAPEEAEAGPANTNSPSTMGAAAATTTPAAGSDVAPQTRPATPGLTSGQTPDSSRAEACTPTSSSGEEERRARRRDVTTREDGLRMPVVGAPARIPSTLITDPIDGSSSPSGPPTPSSSSSSGSPLPTPTPGQEEVPPVLPASGAGDAAAGPALSQLREKLLAVPADAVSRRCLVDGRAILRRRARTPRSHASSSGGGGVSRQGLGHGQAGSAARSRGGESSDGYPSEMME
ncbi:hypothetical protein KVR01_005829 [Diaporthe batatas]|uniref:uncharacterized protein n=1 Tax=Diaporthe batatas TaxID=748121 RepID=UPI001D04B580|nr:uncharacterized protein KVR01_005829 [Diaporthe batatas]KAG8163911.1 hypothetical protein KVR01_005829 [Diaporthe batatas]